MRFVVWWCQVERRRRFWRRGLELGIPRTVRFRAWAQQPGLNVTIKQTSYSEKPIKESDSLWPHWEEQTKRRSDPVHRLWGPDMRFRVEQRARGAQPNSRGVALPITDPSL